MNSSFYMAKMWTSVFAYGERGYPCSSTHMPRHTWLWEGLQAHIRLSSGYDAPPLGKYMQACGQVSFAVLSSPSCCTTVLSKCFVAQRLHFRNDTGGLIVKLEAQGVFAGNRTRPHLRGEVPLPCLAIERGLQMCQLYENWPTAIFDRLGFAKRRHILYRIGYGVDDRGRFFVTTRPARRLAGPALFAFDRLCSPASTPPPQLDPAVRRRLVRVLASDARGLADTLGRPLPDAWTASLAL
jgi:hypothetical protein